MNHELVFDIALCVIAAWVVALVCQVFRQPLLMAYLIAGFMIGPHGFRWVTNAHSIETIASIGLILLLFMIGLEMDLKGMFSAGKAILITAVAQIVGCIALGWVFFRAAGFCQSGLEALYLGVAAAMSSTVIIIKILYDKRELGTLAGRITVGVLVLQDLMVILFLALQPNLRHPAAAEFLLAFAKVLLLVCVAYGAGRFLLPPLFRFVARQPELVVVGALAWCFAMAGLAGELGLSREMGALVAGVVVSSFPYTLDIVAKVTTLRDFFVTLFFVGLGLTIPVPTWDLLTKMLILSSFLIVSRFLTVFTPLYSMRLGHRVSLLPATHLCQMSELSLVLLTLGKQSGDVSEHTISIAAFAFAFLAVGSTYSMFSSEKLVRAGSRLLARVGLTDLASAPTTPADSNHQPRIFLLGFSWTASSLLEEITRQRPELLPRILVVDFNPHVNEQLRRRRVQVLYGDISQRDVLLHAGIAEAELIICSLPDMVLRGTNNMKLLRHLRELNSAGKIVVHAEKLTDISALYAAGANYVTVSRLLEAEELVEVISAVETGQLAEKRRKQTEFLQGRVEVIS